MNPLFRREQVEARWMVFSIFFQEIMNEIKSIIRISQVNNNLLQTRFRTDCFEDLVEALKSGILKPTANQL